MTPFCVLIESNTSGTGQLFAQAVVRQGYRPMLLAMDPARYPYIEQDGVSTIRVDTLDRRAILHECQRLDAQSGVVGVTSSSDYYIPIAAAVALDLGMAGPHPKEVASCRDKHRQRIRLRAAGIGVPDFRPASSVEASVEAACDLGLPVVLKPVAGSGSAGVRLCNDVEAVAEHAASLLSQRHNERGLPLPRRILVEAFAAGPEYSVETFGRQVVGITAKHVGAPPFFVEIGHDHPAVVSRKNAEVMRDTAIKSLEALGLGWGPAHIEMRLCPDRPTIMEVNPRLAGGYIPELVRLASGIDLITETVNLATGQPVSLKPLIRRHASLRFLIPPSAGTLVEILGVEAAASAAGITGVNLYRSCGNRVERHGDFRDRIGHVVACAASGEEAIAAVDSACRLIRLMVETGSSGRKDEY